MNAHPDETPAAPLIFKAEGFGLVPEHARQPLLADLSLSLRRGDILAVLGRHGAGGEVLRDLLAGLPPPVPPAGRLTIGEADAPPPRIVYLAPAVEAPLSPHAGTLSQLARVLARRGHIPLASAREELRTALARLPDAPAPEDLAARPSALAPHALSLAFLALARAQNPDAVLADDPASGLDPGESETLLRLLLEQQARTGFALIYFTGNPAMAARLGGRIAVLRNGRLIEEGSAGRLRSEHAHAYTQALFRAVPRLSMPQGPVRSGPRSEPLLQVRGFAFEKPGRRFDPAKGITFDLRRGASLALIGKHGSGRRALARAVLGLEPAPQGRIVFDAVDLGVLSPAMRTRLRRRVAFISGDDNTLDPRMSVREVVTEPMRAHVNLGAEENRRAADAALRRVGLGDVPLARLAGDLEPLNKRRLQVARILAAGPQLVVLYEPVSRLDALGQALMLDLLKDMRARDDVAYLLVTADIAVAQALSDNALIIRNRAVVESGPLAGIIRAPQEPYTKALVEAVFAAHRGTPSALPSGGDEG